jgi:Mrp family chromosome partitioning ATPase
LTVIDGDADPAFDSVRTTLQSALKIPFAVTVSSSQIDDGKTELAAGTARAFAAAGFNTIVVDAHPGFPGVGPALGLGDLPLPEKLDPAALTIAALRPVNSVANLVAASIGSHKLLDDVSPKTIHALVSDLRAAHQVTIIDTCDVFYDPAVSVPCAAACDGVVLAVRYARNPDADDDRVVATLEKNGARIIGSVTTSYPGPFAHVLKKLITFS